MQTRYVLFALLIAALMTGCGEVVVFGRTVHEGQPKPEVKADPSTASATATTPATPEAIAKTQTKLRTVTLALSPQVAAKVAEDSRFSTDALLAEVKNELQSRKLLDETDSHSSGTAEISIDEYTMQPTSNVILFGNTTNAGTLGGDVQVRDGQGNEMPHRRVKAESRVSIPANGESKNPLRPLYRQFAVMTANGLTDAPVKSNETLDQRPR